MTTRAAGPDARTRARRPRDRKQQIIAAAAERFHESGFHGVAMAEIAADVGITAGALYRHFPTKQELLAQVMSANMNAVEQIMDDVGPADPSGLCRDVLRLVVDRRRRGMLWQLEARNLSPDRLAETREHLRGIHGRLVAAVLVQRPELVEADTSLLAWALLAVLTSPIRHRVALRRGELEAVLLSACEHVLQTVAVPALQPTAVSVPQPQPALAPAARRETLLAAAVPLFHQHGYQAVTVEGIADAAGMTAGSSVYNHFASKQEILLAALRRAGESLQLDLGQALHSSATPAEALRRAVRSYVDLGLRPGSPIGLLVTEINHLPPGDGHRLRRAQREYIDEWARLLPGDQNRARVAVHAALAVINDLARTSCVRKRPGLADELTRLALDILAG